MSTLVKSISEDNHSWSTNPDDGGSEGKAICFYFLVSNLTYFHLFAAWSSFFPDLYRYLVPDYSCN